MPDEAPIQLSQLIDTSRTKEGVWVQYQNTTFQIKVAYYGKPQMQRLFEEAKSTRINMRTLREEEDMDRFKFRKLYANAVIKDWKGLTVAVLRSLIVVGVNGIPDSTEIPCTPENREMLLENSLEFDQWLSSMTQRVETFNQQKREEEIKN
jgi:nicotinamide mononucleotide adenylyltransferase